MRHVYVICHQFLLLEEQFTGVDVLRFLLFLISYLLVSNYMPTHCTQKCIYPVAKVHVYRYYGTTTTTFESTQLSLERARGDLRFPRKSIVRVVQKGAWSTLIPAQDSERMRALLPCWRTADSSKPSTGLTNARPCHYGCLVHTVVRIYYRGNFTPTKLWLYANPTQKSYMAASPPIRPTNHPKPRLNNIRRLVNAGWLRRRGLNSLTRNPSGSCITIES